MWLLIDNYDSFSRILLDYLLQLQADVRCIQNDEYTLEEIIAIAPERIILSPGPKTPDDAGVVMEVIDYFHNKVPILGICLGHQALAQYFGAKVQRAAYPMHGKTSKIAHNNKHVFQHMPEQMEVMRYHSLVVTDYEHSALEPLAYAMDDNSLMAFTHTQYPILGLQFHPESVLTEMGLALLEQWRKYYD